MQSILVATDLSPRADAALSAADRLARQTGARLHLVHALEILGMPLSEALRHPVGPRIRGAEAALAEQVARVVPPGSPLASRTVAFENAAGAVARRAREVGAELVVLGAPAEAVPAGLAPQGTLLAILSGVAVPSLVVRAPLALPLVHAMLPLSATAAGLGILRDACTWLATMCRWGAADSEEDPVTEVEVLHVARRFAEWREIAQELDREVSAANRRLPLHAPLRLRPSVRWGVCTEEEILGVVAEQCPSLVILGPGARVAGEDTAATPYRSRLLAELACAVLVMPERRSPAAEAPFAAREVVVAASPEA